MKHLNAAKKFGARIPATGIRAGFASAMLAAGNATAQTTGPDYSAITGTANWAAVATGVITIFAALAVVLVALRGGRKLLSAIGR